MADRIDTATLIEDLGRRVPDQTQFLDGVRGLVGCVEGVMEDRPDFRAAGVLERIVEPDRTLVFRVVWADDAGRVQVNRGWRVQYSNAIGPYKGGLRFHPDVSLDLFKRLAFEQTFKNALTGLPMGGAKGGSDFDPHGRSEAEIMRFCQAFMTQLHEAIGPRRDVPAGDIGVGAREIGFMFGQYKNITGRFVGALTGKGLEFGGSRLRREATGYGVVYFLREMLARRDESIEGRRAVVSGAGNVATHAAEKFVDMGGTVVTLSDSKGFLHVEDGLQPEQIRWVREARKDPDFRLERFTDRYGGTWRKGEAPWSVACDVALPCATQNEIDRDAALALIDNGCRVVVEGANLPLTQEATQEIDAAGLLHAPGMAANLGGVAMSGLELSQNTARLERDEDDLSEALQRIMRDAHATCLEHGETESGVNYARGAHIAGFTKVADAMTAFGVA
ncbi:NADP-specific glutamate dehydrogenase [Roseibacterium sp. SDUM158017]|uniref:NADP-specific glutamate dehydrogenase n=1 Tax=Roseicyclus salinarum TaxID=3036773 RepID=UPI002414EC57|nr:NADP-specific glutamate dehydrogenase [Roseibacterium sp. SDUM158017]MDG4649597.1 NADP-specific glutamate dehydrogenase [Roseibacterium sp. SDUM158017]